MFNFDRVFVLSSIWYRLARDFQVARPSLTGGNVVNVATCSLTRGRTCVGVGHSCGGCLPPGVLFPLFFPSPPSCQSAPPGTTWIRRVSPGDVRKNYWMNGDVTRPAAWKVCEPVPVRVNRSHPLSLLFARYPAVQPPPSVFSRPFPSRCRVVARIRTQIRLKGPDRDIMARTRFH